MSELGNVIEEAERLEKAATPGPWVKVECGSEWMRDGYTGVVNEDERRVVLNANQHFNPDADEALIAFLRTHIDTLIAAAKRAEQAEAEVGRLREAVERYSRESTCMVTRAGLWACLTPPPTANAGATTLEGAGGEVRADAPSEAVEGV